MERRELIKELLSELSYRSNEGYPILDNKEHISILAEILDEFGLGSIKNELIENLLEAEAKSKTDDLYKSIGGTGYVLAKDYDKWEKNKDAYTGDKFTKGKDGQYTKQGGDDTADDTPKTGTALGPNSDYAKAEREREERVNDKDDKDEVSKETSTEKNKSLKEIDSVSEFNKNPKFAEDGVSDTDFENNPNIQKTDNQIQFTPEELDNYFDNPRKFPKKYEKVLIRILNTKKSNDISITDFTDAAGGGTMSSTAGEILTMIGMSIKDPNKAKEFFDKVENHIKSNGKSSVLDKGWVKSASEVRSATINRYNRQFGEGNWELETMAWDIKEEVEALGLEDYTKNKGFSTDTYAKVNVNGKSILDEVSLKKNKLANLLNTTTSRVDDIYFQGSATSDEIEEKSKLNKEKKSATAKRKKEINKRIDELNDKYNQDIPEDAKVEVVKEKQKNIHSEGLLKNGKNFKKLNEDYNKLSRKDKDTKIRELELLMGQNFSPKQRKQFENALSSIGPDLTLDKLKDINKSLGLKTDSRAVQKTSVMLHALAKLMNNPAGETYDKLVKNSHNHAKAVADSILSNDKAKNGLLQSIREDFPLKSLITGEENMTLGNLSADKGTLAKIFGETDFSKIQENLKVRETPPPAAIVYQAGVEGEVIPIAEIKTRPDGIGYGGNWKLEMKVHPDFATKLEEAEKLLKV